MPAEDTAGEDDSPGFEADVPSVDAAGERDTPFPMAGEDSTGPDGFPPDDGVPFEDAAGVPPVEDGVSPDEGEDFGDYTAYFPLEGETGGGEPLSAMDAALPLPEARPILKRMPRPVLSRTAPRLSMRTVPRPRTALPLLPEADAGPPGVSGSAS